MRVPTVVGDLAEAATVVGPLTPCADLDEIFRDQPRLTSLTVVDGDRIGLVMRDAFSRLMSGPFGYGRTLWARRPVADITDWRPLRAHAAAPIVETAHRLRTRPADKRYDDVSVDLDDGSVGRVSAADLFDGLARQFTYRAVHDDLTGLINRAHFLDVLASQCATGAGDRIALALINLDGIKRINDAHGHVAGDAILAHTAEQLRDVARPGEIVARLGADEFVVLSRSSRTRPADEVAVELGERARAAVGAPRRVPMEEPARASVGVAISGDRADATTLLTEADMAMFRAKQAGGDQVEITIGVEAALAPGGDLSGRSVVEAIDDSELQVWYQPVTRIRDNVVVSVEALVRWQHPGMGLLAPDRFLPGARRAGHMPALDRWVLTRACADLVTLRSRLGSRAPAFVAVNLAPATLATDFDNLVERVLSDIGLPPENLVLELPEDADLDTLKDAGPQLERLLKMGVGIVLDDMGTGSTSLRHLSTLTVGGLKIDAAFVAGMLHNPRDHTVVKLLADLGKGLNLPVTAEGVENAEQLAALGDLGVDNAQGYYLGRPQPFDALMAMLDIKATAA